MHRPRRPGRPWAAGLLLPALLGASLPSPAAERPRIGLVLSGGGARGGAHVGVLRVLEELRVPIDCVAGTSMGAIVGGLYSSGISPAEMERTFRDMDWTDILTDEPLRQRLSFRRKQDDSLPLGPFELGVGKEGVQIRSGIIVGRKIEAVLRILTLHTMGIEGFDDLRLPFRALATDLDTGEPVVLDGRDLATALRASMSIPGVFSPVEWKGRVLVDGGLTNNLPVNVARRLCADRIIAVDVGSRPGDPEGLSALGVLNQTLGVLTESRVEEQRARLGPDDLLIIPELEKISSGSFERIPEASRAGETAARTRETDLRRFSVSEEDYSDFLARQRLPDGGSIPDVRIGAIEVRGLGRLEADVVRRRLETEPGGALDTRVLRADLDRVYRAGEFENVRFNLERDGELNRLVIDARGKSWGPGYLQFGLGAESGFDGDSDLRALILHRRPEMNHLGAEWRSVISVGEPIGATSELFQPLNPRGLWFVAPHVAWERRRDRLLLPNGDRESFDSRVAFAQLDLGMQFSNVAELRFGVRRGILDSDPETETVFPAIDVELGGWTLKGVVDTLDSSFFPTRGTFADAEAFVSREALGATDVYERASLRLGQVGSFGRNILFGSVRLGTDFGSDLPIYDDFELGGFLELSGLEQGALRGDVLALASLGYYWRAFEIGLIGDIYVGMVGQAGNVWDEADEFELGDVLYSGTLFVGADTPFLPVYVAYGLAEGGNDSFYLFIGRIF